MREVRDSALTRRALVAGTLAAVLGEGRAWAKTAGAPRLTDLSVTSMGRSFAGDRRLLATVSPNADSARRKLSLRFKLDRPAKVRLDMIKTARREDQVVWHKAMRLRAGRHRLVLRPERSLPARTYLLRITVTDRRGRSRVYGAERPYLQWRPRAPVVRVLGLEGCFERRSYKPGEVAELVVSADTAALTVQLFRSGPEQEQTYRKDEMHGVTVTEPVTINWQRKRNGPHRIPVRLGDWPSGLYFAKLTAEGGRIGYAPMIIRPAILGSHRVAVVLPTNTWQAYNFRDADGDGWGDTWYAGGSPPVRLDRPHLHRGVPFRFKSYDLGSLRWLIRSGRQADFLAEEDVELFRNGNELAATYDLVVFPGHTEYVTKREYDIVQRYRDVGGNLMFLSANNFFWRVHREGQQIHRDRLWRDLGRPEAGLVGAQYFAGSSRFASYIVAPESPEWPWAGTGLEPGKAFGTYGIEIDARTPASPAGTQVLATIPDVFGPGRTAEMTYYETEEGAKVFAAGALNFGGSAERWHVRHLLENVWRRLTAA